MVKVSFNNKNACFYKSVNEEVENYFASKGISKTGNWKLYSKTIILFSAALLIYTSLIAFDLPLLVVCLFGLLIGQLSAFIGFNVMHDANHGSYSSKKWVNSTLGLSINALGGNSFIWKYKHNILHHTYPNIDGIDDDIAKSPYMRMCESQPWKPAHRYQHIYTPVLYALSSMIWVLYQDFEKYFKPRLGNATIASKMSVTDHFLFWISKIGYLFFYLILPMIATGWLNGLLFFTTLHLGLGFTLALIFQLAHVVESTHFDSVGHDHSGAKKIEHEWAIHQLQTTSDFSPGNPVLSWLLGGLNYQVVHHLFPRISHVHYPAISKIIKAKCEEFNVTYHCIPSFGQAINSHFRQIKRLGRKPMVAILN